MKPLWTRTGLSLLLFLPVVITYAQSVDTRKLDDLRRRYQDSLQSIYITDAALNNLNVHLRPDETVVKLVKSGMNVEALNAFRKFLVDVANDRAFLQLELHQLRALFKRNSDPSAGIQLLPWTRAEVFHIAVFCDRYLQGQLMLAQLKKRITGETITVAESWLTLDGFRQDPYVPVVTMTDTLKDFVLQADRNRAQLDRLATTDPSLFVKIRTFKLSATDPVIPANVYFPFDWPGIVKTEWAKRYKLLESYGKSTDMAAVPVWHKQLDNLQDIEFAQLVRSTGSQKPE
jgi:hypothetical protein